MNGLWTPQSAARQINLCPSQPHYGLHPAMFSGNDSLVLVASVTRYQLLLIYRPRRDGTTLTQINSQPQTN